MFYCKSYWNVTPNSKIGNHQMLMKRNCLLVSPFMWTLSICHAWMIIGQIQLIQNLYLKQNHEQKQDFYYATILAFWDK